MTMPGWYPDPAGGSGRYRFWDGDSWSNDTTSDPAQPPPGQSGKRDGRSGGSATWLIVGLAAVAAVAVIAWLIFGNGTPTIDPTNGPVQEDSNSSTPTVQGWDETSKPTPPPTQQASLAACPYTGVMEVTDQGNDGRLHSGRLSVAKTDGWRYSDTFFLQWVSDIHTVVDSVRPGWISNIGVGTLNAVDGFVSPELAARQTLECFASSGYYVNFTHRVDLLNESTTVSGFPAWHMRSEVHIESADMPEIDGDVVDIIVVDLGDPEKMGLYISSVTIGDTARQPMIDAAIASLRVD